MELIVPYLEAALTSVFSYVMLYSVSVAEASLITHFVSCLHVCILKYEGNVFVFLGPLQIFRHYLKNL